jgi:hypothetical protein
VRVAVKAHDEAVLADLRKKVEALRDLRPVLKDIAGEVDRMTATSLSDSRRVDGLPFADLAESTKIGRLRQRKAIWRKIRGGKKTTGEQRAQRLSEALASTKFTPLVNTGRGARSARATVAGRGSVRFSVVQYMAPHITGGKDGRPPQRNFSVFRRVGGNWQLAPKLTDYIKTRLDRALGVP